MPIVIQKDLPAFDILTKENIFVMATNRAITQDIRPIEIAIVNLMPTKIETETQLLRLLGNTPLQVNITLVNMASHKSKNTCESHMARFYKNFDEIKNLKFDGMVITGAPVETLNFEDVDYWDELVSLMNYARKNVTTTIYICWGAQAALYHYYGIDKIPLGQKFFGIFPTVALHPGEMLTKGLSDIFYVPHSRHTAIMEKEVYKHPELTVLAKSDEAGATIIKSNDNKSIFITGHVEYDRDTLKKEYFRDLNKGLPIESPKNYFADNKCDKVNMSWTSTATILFSNWLNYYVYQATPYDIEEINNEE
ncbi:MAG: homoserine O-succinyltransferase [Clostridia bacterium]|nr:homoserine O-succinyltransferase [Clostridia bacterium]